MSTRKEEQRLRRFLYKHKLLFVRVGARVSDDRVVETHTETNGATRSNREYNTLLRDIVMCILES